VVAGVALYELAEAGHDLAYEQEQAMRQYAQLSASMSAVWAELDAERTVRDLDIGDQNAASSQALADAINRMEESTKGIRVILGDLYNLFGATFLNTLVELLEAGKELGKLIPGAAEAIKSLEQRQNEGSEMFGEFLENRMKWADRLQVQDAAAADAAMKAAQRMMDEQRRR
jgi:hypothetical protein